MTNTKMPTLRERHKAQPKAIVFFSDAEKAVIKETVGAKLTEPQYKIFLYTCQALGLNPLLNEIACVTYRGSDGTSTMSIQVMRDGFLTIAHRSGKFAGMESGVKDEGKGLVGWAKVYHKDFTVPVYQEADFKEYSTDRNLWSTKPRTMIKKVAESMALRKAFNVSGVYAPEEMDKELSKAPKKILVLDDGDAPATEVQKETIRSLDKNKTVDNYDITKQEASELIGKLTDVKGVKSL